MQLGNVSLLAPVLQINATFTRGKLAGSKILQWVSKYESCGPWMSMVQAAPQMVGHIFAHPCISSGGRHAPRGHDAESKCNREGGAVFMLTPLSNPPQSPFSKGGREKGAPFLKGEVPFFGKEAAPLYPPLWKRGVRGDLTN